MNPFVSPDALRLKHVIAARERFCSVNGHKMVARVDARLKETHHVCATCGAVETKSLVGIGERPIFELIT